jgi:hypothetical protein
LENSWTDRKEELQSKFREIDKSVILTTKNSKFWKLGAFLLSKLGLMSEKEFLEDFATTLGPVQAYPENWSYGLVSLIGHHESGHVRQARWFGLGISPWLGLIPMGLAYILLPLPILFAWCRYRLELSADKYLWKYLIKNNLSDLVLSQAEHSANNVSSSEYLYSVPKCWALWGFRRAALKLLNGR